MECRQAGDIPARVADFILALRVVSTAVRAAVCTLVRAEDFMRDRAAVCIRDRAEEFTRDLPLPMATKAHGRRA